MREIRTYGSVGGTVNRNGKRMVRHGRGNPETELRRNLKRSLIPLPDNYVITMLKT
jgi:hypothetical protein